MCELTLIDDSRLDCMYKLTSWSDMQSTILANLDDNFSNVWQNDVKVMTYAASCCKLLMENTEDGKVSWKWLLRLLRLLPEKNFCKS
mgnify:FL=1